MGGWVISKVNSDKNVLVSNASIGIAVTFYPVVTTVKTLIGKFIPGNSNNVTIIRILQNGTHIDMLPGGIISINGYPPAPTIAEILTQVVSVFPDGSVGISGPAADNLDGINSGLKTINSLVPDTFDYISLHHNDDGDVDIVTYKSGGSSGIVVSTLILGYTSGSLTSVSKS